MLFETIPVAIHLFLDLLCCADSVDFEVSLLHRGSLCMSYFCVYLFLPWRERELGEIVSRVSFEDTFSDHCVCVFSFKIYLL